MEEFSSFKKRMPILEEGMLEKKNLISSNFTEFGKKSQSSMEPIKESRNTALDIRPAPSRKPRLESVERAETFPTRQRFVAPKLKTLPKPNIDHYLYLLVFIATVQIYTIYVLKKK